MNDYSTLAETLRCSGREEKHSSTHQDQAFDSSAFFVEVKAHIIREIESANAELLKRRLALIERVLVPGYCGKLCLTFGTVLMCCVDLDVKREQILSTIYGPPNRRELSRKEYPLSRAVNGGQTKRVLSRQPTASTTANGPGAVASDIVSEILETGIRVAQKRLHPNELTLGAHDEPHFAEFWISLASLLQSYTALHGSNGNRQAEIEALGHTITVRHAEKCLILKRHHAIVTWTRENGESGALEFTDHGSLRSDEAEEAMDLVAEQWARELMQRAPLVQIRN